MTDAKLQPMITVKKADGTTERISLAEFKARQAAKKPAPVAPSAAKIVPASASKPTPLPPLPRAPVVKPAPAPAVKKIPPTAPPPITKEDAKSLLSEDLPQKDAVRPITSDHHFDKVEEIIKKLSFQVPADYRNRLRGVVQLRLKDVRGEGQTRDIVLRSIKDGGLGMTSTQAEELLSQMRPPRARPPQTAGIKPPERSLSVPPKSSPPALRPQQPSPATATPFNSFEQRPAVSAAPSPPAAKLPANFTMRPPAARQPMADIVAKNPTMGPLEEIKFISLTDFRRLSANPVEAANRLKQKFLNLKDESYLLYLDALKSWRISPLFLEYMSRVGEALSAKKRLDGDGNDRHRMQMSEINALIDMEKQLL